MAKASDVDDLEAELEALEAELAELEGKPKKPRKAKKEAAPPGDDAPKRSRFSMPKPKLGGRKKAEATAETPHAEAAAEPAAKTPAAEPAPEPADDEEEASPSAAAKLGLGRFGRKKQAAPQTDAATDAPDAPAEDAAQETRRKLPKIGLGKLGRKKADAEADAEPAATPPQEPAAEPPARPPTPEPVAEPAAEPAPREVPPELKADHDPAVWRRDDGAWVREVRETPPEIVRRVLDEDDAVVREEPATEADLDEVSGTKAEKGVGRLLGGAGGAAARIKGFRFGRKGGDAE